MYSEWNVWDMTNGEEWTVKAEGIEDFTIPGPHRTWIRLDSKYDKSEKKTYYYFREIETRRIFRVNKK